MPCPTIHEFAAMADAIYSPSNSVLVPNYTRISFRERSNGFKGGLYRQSSGRNQTNIIAFAGTDMGGEAGTDIRDLAADVGFAGRSVTLAVYITNPAAAISIELGRQLLEWQFREALALVRDTLGTAGHGRLAGLGMAWLGKAWQARQAGRGMARHGKAWQARSG